MASSPNPWDYAERYETEHAHQAALFMWANMAARFGLNAANDKFSYTEPGWALNYQKFERFEPIEPLKWFHAIHNQGHGDVIRGAKAKAEGVKAGVFDMFLPVPVRYEGGFNKALPATYYAGLYLELKVGKNQPSNDQLAFQTYARGMGYAAEIAWGWIEARQKLLQYLHLPVDFAVR